jgi:hypothetical protein
MMDPNILILEWNSIYCTYYEKEFDLIDDERNNKNFDSGVLR